MLRFISLISALLIFQVSRSQEYADTIYFMTGEIGNVQMLDTADFKVTFNRLGRNGKIKKEDTDREDVFMVKYKNGNERYFYRYDTLVGNIFTIDETRRFVFGENDAQRCYRPWLDMVGGFVVGTASTIVSPNLMAPIPVFAFAALVRVPKVKINKNKIRSEDLLKYDTYLLGFERVARKKKTINALLGGAIGIGAGFALTTLVFKEKIY